MNAFFFESNRMLNFVEARGLTMTGVWRSHVGGLCFGFSSPTRGPIIVEQNNGSPFNIDPWTFTGNQRVGVYEMSSAHDLGFLDAALATMLFS